MKPNLMLLTIVMYLTLHFCTHKEKRIYNHNDKEIVEVWNNFLKTIEQKNKNEFRKLSSDEIDCYVCPDNTPQEYEEFNKLRAENDDWHEIYNSKTHISIDTFLQQDFDVIFNNNFVTTLKTKKTIFSKADTNVYQILVTTTEPTLEHEGGQHNFKFKKENGIYKFCEIGTIP